MLGAFVGEGFEKQLWEMDFFVFTEGMQLKSLLFPRVLSPRYHKDLFSCVHFRERLGVMRSGTVFAFWTLR